MGEGCKDTDFRSLRYRERGGHITRMKKNSFAKNPVLDFIVDKRGKVPDMLVKELWFGDPSAFPGLDAYEGIHRFLTRFLTFHNPSAYSRYLIWGYEPLKSQIRRGSIDSEPGYLPVPDHVAVYITPGVAGALKLLSQVLFLPPRYGEEDRDIAIMPELTYLSHSAEAAGFQASVRTCNIDREGQIDLSHMESVIDNNTRVIILATVGNPLSIALKPALFDDLLRLVDKKEREYGHPIIVIADVIYEHFRRNRKEKIDPIQHSLRLGLDVPVIEVSSFSKMMAMAGQRMGYLRFHWDPNSRFHEERHDVFDALETIYGITLDPVSSLIQKGLGELYTAITSKRPVEDELAPTAAILAAMRDLTELKGGGDTLTLVPDEYPEQIIRKLGLDPSIWFTTSAVAKRTRKLAQEVLRGYEKGDISTRKVEMFSQRLIRSGMIEVHEVEMEREVLIGIMRRVIFESIRDNEIEDAISHSRASLSVEDVRMLFYHIASHRERDLRQPVFEHLGIPDATAKKVKMTFYRLNTAVPLIPRKNGQLDLYGIANRPEWIAIAKQIAERDEFPFEHELYEKYKKRRRAEVFERVDFFVTGLEKLRTEEKLGIYLHPAYYDENGRLDLGRINSFYVLWGFEQLRHHPCQALEVASLCFNNSIPILGNTPGEVFLPVDSREGRDSFVRTVALSPISEMEEILQIIKLLAHGFAYENAKATSKSSTPPEYGM